MLAHPLSSYTSGTAVMPKSAGQSSALCWSSSKDSKTLRMVPLLLPNNRDDGYLFLQDSFMVSGGETAKCPINDVDPASMATMYEERVVWNEVASEIRAAL
jgi:hypothetical protein